MLAHQAKPRSALPLCVAGSNAEVNLLSRGRPNAHSHAAGAHLGAQGPRITEQLVQHALQLHACAGGRINTKGLRV